jgi:hypothetical protein
MTKTTGYGAIREALQLGRAVFPVCDIAWRGRAGQDLGHGRYAPVGADLPGTGIPGGTDLPPRLALGQVLRGGWAPITYGDTEPGTLQAARTSVTFADEGGRIARMLERYEPTGSPAWIAWASPAVSYSDWFWLFRGIVDDWRYPTKGTVQVLLKADDSPLVTSFTQPLFEPSAWVGAGDPSVFSKRLPLALGIFDSFSLVNKGALPAFNVRFDGAGYWWFASILGLRNITNVFTEGVRIDPSRWTTLRGMYGGVYCTLISFSTGYQPETATAKVTFDCEGPDASGLESGGTSLLNPIRQRRAILESFVFQDRRVAGFAAASPLIDDTSWEDLADYFDLHEPEGTAYFGGVQNATTGHQLLEELLGSRNWLRACWTPLGRIQLYRLLLDDERDEDDPRLDLDLIASAGTQQVQPGDRRETNTRVVMPYLRQPAEGRYISALSVDDPAANSVSVIASIPDPCSQGRFSNV